MPALGLKLGSNPFHHGALALDRYVAEDAPQVPPAVFTPNQAEYRWGMLGNDSVGDCVEAALYHADESLYLKRGTPAVAVPSPRVPTALHRDHGIQPQRPGHGPGHRLSVDALNSAKVGPGGFQFAQMQADLAGLH